MGRADSILSMKKECFVCGRSGTLHLHHVFGGANRKKSDIYGCWCWLCPEHHNMSREGVHLNRKLDLQVKEKCQEEWEAKYGSRGKFRAVFGKSYL